MQLEPRMGQKPLLHHRRLVGGEVVADHVDRQAGIGLAVDVIEKVAEVHRPMRRRQLPDHLAGGGVQGGEQVHGAVPDVVEAAPLRGAGHHGQHRSGPLKSLDLRLLVHRENCRVRRRGEIQPDHVADLVDQQRVRGDLEVLRSPRLQPERPPDPQHTRRRDPHSLRQLPLRPVGGTLGHLFESAHHHLFHLGVGDGAGHTGTWLVGQPVEPASEKSGPPPAYGRAIGVQPCGHRGVVQPVCAGEHDPGPSGQALRGRPAFGPPLQHQPLVLG